MKVFSSKICLALLIFAGLFGTGCETNTPRIFRRFSLPPLQIAAAKMDDPLFPDKRRQGVNEVVVRSVGRRPPYTTKYIQLAQNDPDYTVRAIAIRALNRSRDASADPVFVRALSDDQPLVRLEAAKALNRLPDPTAVPLLIVHLQPTYDTGNFDDRGTPIQQDEIQDVRIASAEALAHYKALNVARALVDMLDSRDFGIASEAHNSLRMITGQDFAYDQGAWLNYLTNHAPGA
jgi:hypothetical protein